MIQILGAQPKSAVIECGKTNGQFLALDLSESNGDLTDDLLNDSVQLQRYIDGLLAQNDAFAGFGGYLEKRRLYRQSDLFAADGEGRDVHLGVDLWAPAATKVLAAIDGTVHSFANNTGRGNYGPTVILEHRLGGTPFYTLYGHLDLASIENLETGSAFRKGAVIGKLGEASVNGGYPPHLHFQIVRDLQGFYGDYPGVCAGSELPYYRDNCPDPDLLLKLKQPQP